MRRAILSIMGIGLLCLCGFILYIYWEAYGPLDIEPCKPLTYPDGQKTTLQAVITTSDSLATVVAFYDQRLSVRPPPPYVLQWRRLPLSDGGYSYSCTVADQHVYTETGCIELFGDDKQTRIEVGIYEADDAFALCPKERERVIH